MDDKMLSGLKGTLVLAAGLVIGRSTSPQEIKKVEQVALEFAIPQITVPGIVTNIHDLDTLTVEVKQKINVRMLDNYAIELSDENGLKARDLLIEKCPIGSEVIVQIPFKQDLSKMLTLGRVLGRVYKDGEDLSEFAVSTGFATKEKIR